MAVELETSTLAASSITVGERTKLDPSWMPSLEQEFSKPYMQELREMLKAEMAAGIKIFPQPREWFAAFARTPFEKVKVVIIGQDPYHGDGQAHGLCFSVRPGIQVPPSLQNIYKELKTDIPGFSAPNHGYLVNWADQGVLMLNAVLTVRQGQANAHQGKGWENFTDAAIQALNHNRDHLVFVLWGAYAQKKGSCIDRERHLVIESPHPSPLSASRGFFKSQPFSRINRYLEAHNIEPIDWHLPSVAAHSS